MRYANGHEAPLEPKLAAGHMSQLGYRKCSEADHIRRDVDVHVEEQKKMDGQRCVVTGTAQHKCNACGYGRRFSCHSHQLPACMWHLQCALSAALRAACSVG